MCPTGIGPPVRSPAERRSRTGKGGAPRGRREPGPRGARLLERYEPGTALRAEPDERVSLRGATDVCHRLWIPDPGGITRVATEVRAWASSLEARHIRVGRPF